MGRPKLSIDLDVLKGLAEIQCTYTEMASILKCSVKTLQDFAEIINEGKEAGKKSLRRTQFELAKKSPAMAIFLGKQYLGQKDEQFNGPKYTKIIAERVAPQQVQGHARVLDQGESKTPLAQ
jgi:hypothetical protein